MGHSPLKVMLVAPSFGDVGGIERFVIRLARAIHSAPDMAVAICFKRANEFELRPQLPEEIEGLPYPVTFVDRASPELARAIRSADVLHSQNPSLDTALIAALLRKPHVMTMHGSREKAPRLRDWLANRIPTRRTYNSYFGWDSWEPRRRRTSARLPVISELPTGVVDPGERRGFLFVGRWVANKGVDILVEAYARARIDRERWPLVIAGDGPLRPAIESEVDRLGLDTVGLPGFLTGERRDAAIRGAKWMVVPSDTLETFGLGAIEARNVGVPCICTRDGGLPEAAGSHSLLCEPGDPDGLARALERAAGMEEPDYRKLADETRTELLAELRPMEVYLDLYRELAGR